MRIQLLVENISNNENLENEHGLSLYIETGKERILFDTGASGKFLDNAKKMNIDLLDVQKVIISHGHYDHGGGLNLFLNFNKNAEVYVNKYAFDDFYSNKLDGSKSYIGLDKTLRNNSRLIFVDKDMFLDENKELFSGVKCEAYCPSGNNELYTLNGEFFERDSFFHEQNLIIEEGHKIVLIAGCAHNGIVNIMKEFFRRKNRMPDYVVGGFHLYSRSTGKTEERAFLEKLGNYLLSTGSKFYTCHCTGLDGYEVLKQILGDKIEYISTGEQVLMQ